MTQAANLLRVSIQGVKNYERRGLLHPKKAQRIASDGRVEIVAVYDPQQIHEIVQGKDRKKIWSRGEAVGDTSTWLTRLESASFLSCSPQTLKNYEQRNRLHPLHVRRRDSRGHEQIVAIYDPEELRKLPRGRVQAPREQSEVESRAFSLFSAGKTPHEVSESRAFALFNQGKTKRDVVIELHETSDRVRELYERWLEDGEDLVTQKGSLDARAFALFMEGKSNQEVVVALGESSDRVRELRERWTDDGGADLVITPVVKPRFEKLLGPFNDVAELLGLVEKLAASNATNTNTERAPQDTGIPIP